MKSLKRTIIFSILTLTLLGSVVFLNIAMRFSKTALSDVFTTDVKDMTQIIANVVSDENNLRLDLIKDLSSLPFIRDNSVSLMEKQRQLHEITLTDKNFDDIYIVDTFGMTKNTDGSDKFIGRRVDFIKARQGTPAVYGPTVDGDSGKLVLYYSVPIYDQNNEITAVMSLTTDGKLLSEICSEYKIGASTHPFIVEKTTIDLYGHSDHQKVIDRFNYREEAKKPNYKGFLELLNLLVSRDSGVYTFTENGKTVFYSFSSVPDTQWSVVACIPRKELDDRTRSMSARMGIAAMVLLISGLFLAFLLSRETNPLKVLGKSIVDIGSGNADLTRRLEIKHVKREIGDVVLGFNSFVEKLQEIVSSIRESESILSESNLELQKCSEETSAYITQIMGNILGVTSEISNETKSVSETATAIQQITANINSLENMIATQSENVEEATAAVEEMVGNINAVNHSVNTMVSAFNALEENAKIGIQTQANVNDRLHKIDEESKMLQEANAVISAIAEQTNLLAMNAAIEAAHAGEAGRGFSVVADEIRKLSENSSSQSESIGQELSSIQNSINYVVSESNKAADAFTSVAENIKKTDEVIQMIKGAMEEQQVGSKQITDSLYAMNNSTSEVRQAAQEMSEGSKQILSEVNTLQSATIVVNESINEMEQGAKNITSSGKQLVDIAKNLSESVETIHHEIGQFKV